MDSVSFKARFVDSVNIKAVRDNGRLQNKTVSFVKRNPDSKLDYYSMSDIVNLWEDGVNSNYAQSMMCHSNVIEEGKHRDIYFLTEQTDNFRKIIPEKVLGMVEVTKYRDYSKIDYIQTKADSIFKARGRTHKGVGWAMLKMVEKLYGNKKIILHSVKEAVEFYKKYGFVVTYENCTNPKMELNRRARLSKSRVFH